MYVRMYVYLCVCARCVEPSALEIPKTIAKKTDSSGDQGPALKIVIKAVSRATLVQTNAPRSPVEVVAFLDVLIGQNWLNPEEPHIQKHLL